MAALNQIYKCDICGNMVEIVHAANQVYEVNAIIVCCGVNMKRLPEQNKEEGVEKHRPVIEAQETSSLIKVGSTPHPMEQEHYIEWIEIITKDNGIFRKYLSPDMPPEATFALNSKEIKYARAYCNVHGLWRS